MHNAIKEISFSITTTLVALGIYQVLAVFVPEMRHSAFYLILLIYFIQEVITGQLLRKFGENREKFVHILLIITGVKLLVAMIVSITTAMLVPALTVIPGLLYLFYLIAGTWNAGKELRHRLRANR